MDDTDAAPPSTLSERFSPEQVQSILQRATELDAQSEHAEVGELMRVAREAGIDLRAMEQAIEEVTNSPQMRVESPRVPPPAPTVTSDTMVRSILSAAVLGVGAGALMAFGVDLYGLALGGLFVFSLVRAVQLGRKGALLEFELQNLVVMLVSALSALPFMSVAADDMIASVLVLWMVTTLLGGVVAWWRGRSEDPVLPLAN